ncbi:FtsK/SpoIIIE domain-containing protein [Streptomyces sp.]|uniref:FtsK/SpoIIIE domain-containing protein n=1 Tax=Streptomyces sp. TaxID=1931 RepID=UPI002811B4E4|nr:FtsK/SpoIIIE domain-containing protein [Streptomyces sp.]
MTDTVVQLHKDTPQDAQDAAPASASPASPERPRRRVRIDHLRRIVVEVRADDGYRALVRHAAYTLGGARVLTRRAWDSRTTARHERMMRAAEAAGNEELVRQWEQRAYAYRFARHRRRVELLQMVMNAPKAIATGTGAAAGVLLLLGVMLAWANHDISDVLTPLAATIELVGWVAFLASVVWEPLLYSLPVLGLAAAWSVGRRQHTAPAWALPADAEDRDVVPDEGAILKALGNLGIAPLNRAIKDGWQARWVSPTTRSGNGWHTQLQLPMGVTVEMINLKKNVLAHNLLRKPVEVWPTEPPKQPGTLDLWVADQGSLSGAVPPWPLLTEGTTDYFKGVPVAVSQRGEPIVGRLMASNWMVGGIMGSGKTSIVVALLLGAILDPLVVAEVYCMAYNVDFDPLKPRLKTLVKGDDDEDIEAALQALRNLRDEVTARGKLLELLGGDATKVTREMALQDPRMRPKVVVFDECHELFMHKEYGKEAAELAIKVMKKARKVAITLIWVTVSPTADSLPRDVTRNTSHRVAFAVGDHVANDGLLGSGRHKAGITATTLIPGEDIGTAVTVGFTNKPFEVIRSHYVAREPEKGIDEVTPVVDRALHLLDGTPAADGEPMFEPADPLADVAAVLGTEPRMLTQEVLHRLAERRPDAYREWGPADLKRALEPYNAEQYKSAGKSVVARDRVLEALADRAADTEADLDEERGAA